MGFNFVRNVNKRSIRESVRRYSFRRDLEIYIDAQSVPQLLKRLEDALIWGALFANIDGAGFVVPILVPNSI